MKTNATLVPVSRAPRAAAARAARGGIESAGRAGAKIAEASLVTSECVSGCAFSRF